MSSRFIIDGGEMKVVLPLTAHRGKIRLKRRSAFYGYGMPFFGRSNKIGIDCYLEWQIGYDIEATEENKSQTSLNDKSFVASNGKSKYAYELGEILFHAVNKGYVSLEQVKDAYSQILAVADSDTLDMSEDMMPSCKVPIATTVNGIEFYRSSISYPKLIYRFGQYDIFAEVAKREQQYASMLQPMLYVCLPLAQLRFKRSISGRTLDVKETADWIIGKEEAALSLELFRIFGMLSPKHRFDVLAIFKMLFPDVCQTRNLFLRKSMLNA